MWAYALIPTSISDHTPRAEQGIFVGYSDDKIKGYRVYLPQINDIIESAHCQFGTSPTRVTSEREPLERVDVSSVNRSLLYSEHASIPSSIHKGTHITNPISIMSDVVPQVPNVFSGNNAVIPSSQGITENTSLTSTRADHPIHDSTITPGEETTIFSTPTKKIVRWGSTQTVQNMSPEDRVILNRRDEFNHDEELVESSGGHKKGPGGTNDESLSSCPVNALNESLSLYEARVPDESLSSRVQDESLSSVASKDESLSSNSRAHDESLSSSRVMTKDASDQSKHVSLVY